MADGSRVPSTPPHSAAPLPADLQSSLVSNVWTQRIKRLQLVGCLGATAYLVFFHSFGEGEHCFSPIRRVVKKQLDRFLTPTPEEAVLIAQIKMQQQPAVAPAEPTRGSSGSRTA